MRETLGKLFAGFYMIVILVMVWLPIYCHFSNVDIPEVVSRHVVAANFIWYGAAVVLSSIPATLLEKKKYISWATSIGITLVIVGLILCNVNF